MPVSRNLVLLRWFHFWADFRPYAPIAILYFANVSGSYALGMSIYSATRLTQSLFEVPTGVISDRVGRKQTVVYGALAGVFALAFYALGASYGVLLLGAIFEGLGRAFYSGNNEALLHDTVTELEQRDSFREHLGKISSMYQVGLAVSAVLGSLIAAISFQVVMWVSVIPMVLAFAVSLRLVEPRARSQTDTNIYAHLSAAFRNFAHNRRLRTLSIAGVLSMAIGESAWLLRSAFIATVWPIWAIGFSQLMSNVGAAFSYYYAGRVIQRFGELRLLVGGKSLGEAVNLFALVVPTVVSPALMALTSIFFGVNNIAQQSLMQQEFTDEQRATMGSLNSFVGSLVFAVFSFLLGALADRIGAASALGVAILLSVIPTTLYWRVLRPRREIHTIFQR